MKLYYIVLSQTAVRKKAMTSRTMTISQEGLYFTFEIIKWNIFIMHEQEGYV